ncbi:hypothetical protein ACIQJT_33050 [Streptomyces sp. NPDC091972]|uniref:hypothetical protein n=1 Tax=unclassified Streptomyces TaxID=2593676 RepID=UPI00341C35D8
MPRPKHAVAVVLTTVAALTALAPQAVAAPMPWETSRTPSVTPHHIKSTPTDNAGTLTVLCVGGCYQ